MDKDTFFRATVPKTATVEINEGEKITIRQFSAQELLDYVDTENEKLQGARAIVASVMNGNGGLMFTESDIPQIMAMSAEIFRRLNLAINQLNNLSKDPAKN